VPVVAQAVRRSLVSDQVFRILCQGILSGSYEPGEKLPTQRALAADLGVNMASVREAVKRLEQLRLVEVRHGDAMRVRDWRAHGGLDVVAHMLLSAGGVDRSTVEGLLEARRLMLREAARLAAQRRTKEQAKRLTELAGRLRDPGDAAQTLDWAFMSELAHASGNLVFVLIMNSIRELYFENADLFSAVVGAPENLAPDYEQAANAIAKKNADEAAIAIERLTRQQEKALLGG
jgi:GntR family transcriptional regulator, transcriptional repressor for pyruvate dehydrogenase complex